MRYVLAALFFQLTATAAFAQNDLRNEKIHWTDEVRQINTPEGTENILHFDGAINHPDDASLPMVYKVVPASSGGEAQVRITNATFEPLDNAGLIEDRSLIGDQIETEAFIGYERKQPHLIVQFVPLRQGPAGQIEKLVSYDLEVDITPSAERSQNRRSLQFASNSVLRSGEWHKIGISRSGAYRMDKQYLEDNLGWDVSNIDPRDISIYGNGGGMLPEPLSQPAPDDLQEIAIDVTGENDGSFDDGDAIIFYGEGPTKMNIDSSNPDDLKFFHQYHLYDSLTYYFITKDKGEGKRISTQQSEASFDQSVGGYSYYTHHEEELDNLTSSGREFFGESFDIVNTERSFSLEIPNVKTNEPVLIESRVAARSVIGPSKFTMNVNGQQLATANIGSVNSNYWDEYANSRKVIESYSTNSSNLNIDVHYQPNGSDPDSEGWLDYIRVNARVQPKMNGDQMHFADLETFGSGNAIQYKLQGSGNLTIWDVTDYANVHEQQTSHSGGQHTFNLSSNGLPKFFAFTGNTFYEPSYKGTVANQNLHGNLGQPEMVIVTHPTLKSEAERLANFHRNKDEMNVKVVEVEKIYNEFSGGSQDITAIRNMMKMLYDRASGESEMPKYLLMFGDASYDYKNIEISPEKNTNLVPSYQSYESLHRSDTYVSDDYFGLLDDNEGQNIVTDSQLMDIGIGRLMADDAQEAKTMVDKILHYHKSISYGSWRNTVTFIGDDEDGNTHIKHADWLAGTFNKYYPAFNIDKIFLDAYEQVSTPGGNRYPEVEEAINSRVFSGTLLMNYTGHGGEGGLAHERIVTHESIKSWDNYDRLMLLVTATCSFTRFDNPNVETGGELSMTSPKGGAVALISTVRLVYSGDNYTLNDSFIRELFKPKDGRMPTLGEVMMHTKNRVGKGANNRKFALLGDPAMTIGYPELGVETTTIQGKPFVQNKDTISALEKVTITGQVTSNGAKASTFNGIVYPTIFDKPETVQTLKNDAGSNVRTFEIQDNIIYKGKASVTNGEFEYTFVVPKDINYEYGPGKISYYANDGTLDANGHDTVIVGGSADSFPADNKGPEVKVFMNDESFVFGGITDPDPIMLVKLSDENGINTAGNAIGHNITGILDEQDNDQLVLNEFYEAELDDHTRGEVRYPLTNLESGPHNVEVTAWDVYNNSGKGYTEFVVAESSELALDHVLNYPNPFTTNTEFWFEHNKPGQQLAVRVEIYTVSGRLVKTIREQVIPEGYRVTGIDWDGLDDYGDEIGKGVYVYKVSVAAEDNTAATEFEKLVILR